MSRSIAAAAALAALFGMQLLAAGQGLPEDAPRKVQQVTLSPPKDASIRQKSGPARTFTLISLTEDSIKVRTSAGKEIEIEMDKIQTIRTRDGEFDYSPGEETFASLLRRATRINGVMVETVDVYDPIERIAPGEEEPEERPRPANNGHRANPPAVAANNDPGAEPGESVTRPSTAHSAQVPSVTVEPSNPEPVTSEPADATTSGHSENPAPGTTIYTCATCGKELPPGIKDGEKCPHCGIVFWSAGPPVAVAANSGDNSGNSGYPAATGYPTSAGNNPASAPVATTPGVSTTSFSDVPMWMKVGFFVGLLVIGWLLLQRR